jgi:hypothetical protein
MMLCMHLCVVVCGSMHRHNSRCVQSVCMTFVMHEYHMYDRVWLDAAGKKRKVLASLQVRFSEEANMKHTLSMHVLPGLHFTPSPQVPMPTLPIHMCISTVLEMVQRIEQEAFGFSSHSRRNEAENQGTLQPSRL